MEQNTFVYSIYIKASAEAVWEALTDGRFTRQYWKDNVVESDWKPGSPVTFTRTDGKQNIAGNVIACDPPRFMEWTFRDVLTPKLAGQPETTVTYEIEETDAGTKVTVTHQAKNETVFGAISNGWPYVLSGLKSLLETGKPLAA